MRLKLRITEWFNRPRVRAPLAAALVFLPILASGLAGKAAWAESSASLQFQPGAAALAPGLPANAQTLTRIGQLLQRHGQGSTLALLLEGRADCPDDPSCDLLRRRVETVLVVLAADWPASAGAFPTDRLRWQAIPNGHAQLQDDRLRLLQAPGGTPDFADCGAVLWLQDPLLPPGSDGAAGRTRLLPGTHRRPQQPARLSVGAAPGQAVLVLKAVHGGPDTRITLPAGSEMDLDLADMASGPVTVRLQPAEVEIAAGRTIADQLRPWSGEIPDQSEEHQACRFRILP